MQMQEDLDSNDLQMIKKRIWQRINGQIGFQVKFRKMFIKLFNIIFEQFMNSGLMKVFDFIQQKERKQRRNKNLQNSKVQQSKSSMLHQSSIQANVLQKIQQEQQSNIINNGQIQPYLMIQSRIFKKQKQSQEVINADLNQIVPFEPFQIAQNNQYQNEQQQEQQVQWENSVALDLTYRNDQHSLLNADVQNKEQKQSQKVQQTLQTQENQKKQKTQDDKKNIKNKQKQKKGRYKYLDNKMKKQKQMNSVSTNQNRLQTIKEINPIHNEINIFRRCLEQGDFLLNKKMKHGYLLYGMQDVGKTCAANILSGKILKGKKQSGGNKIQVIITHKQRFVIGSDPKKKFIIPQVFKLGGHFIVNEQKYIIDLPGFSHNNKNVLDILFNGYFRYQVYSKVPNMKFILCFQPAQLQNKPTDIIFTISNFIKNFNNFTQIKHQIFKSSGFLFNKVDKIDQKPSSYHIIRDNLQKLAQSLDVEQNEQSKNIKELIENVTKNNKIFIIHKIMPKQQIRNPQLMGFINLKIQSWWTRQTNPQINQKDIMKEDQDKDGKQSMKKMPQSEDICNMDKVATYLGDEIAIQTAQSQASQQQYKQFVSMYNKKIKNLICGDEKQDQYSLKKILDEIVIDAMGPFQSHICLNVISVPVKKYYQERKDKIHTFQHQKQQIKNFAIKLFETKEYLSPSKQVHMKMNYFLKKHTFLKKIQQFLDLLNMKQLTGSKMSQIQECTQIFFSIIKYFQILQYNGQDKKGIILPYGYIFKRLIQQAKIFMSILTDFRHIKGNELLEEKPNELTINLFAPLKSFSQYTFTYEGKKITAQQLHEKYVQKFNINQTNKQIDCNDRFVDFFMQVKQVDDDKKQLIVRIILKYSDKILRTHFTSFDQHHKLMKKLIIGINYCYDLKLAYTKGDKKKNILLILRKLTIFLGQAFERQGLFQKSIRVFDSINFKNTVCRLYRLWITRIENQKRPSINVRLKFIDYLKQNERKQQAARLMYQTFEGIDSIKELQKFDRYSNELSNMIELEEGYMNEQIFGKLDQNLLKELETTYKVNEEQKGKRMRLY